MKIHTWALLATALILSAILTIGGMNHVERDARGIGFLDEWAAKKG